MKACRCAALVAALSSGLLVVPAGAQPPPSQASPVAIPQPGQPAVQEVPPVPAQPPQPVPAPRAGRPPMPLPGQGKAAPPAPRANWEELGLRGFSVALVVGDLAGASAADNLPPGAKKALADMRDFLPYKSYRLLDTHWILCCSGTGGHATVSGRLRGAEEDEYVFYIQVRPGSDPPGLGVTFTLRGAAAKYTDAAAAEGEAAAATVQVRTDRGRQVTELRRQREEIEKRSSEARRKGGKEEQQAAAIELENVRRNLAELERAERAATVRGSSMRQVLDSTFSMRVGETVVIGTSRLKGEKALIALLTAAPRTTAGSPRE